MKAAIVRHVESGLAAVLFPSVALFCTLISIWTVLSPLLATWDQPEYSHAWLIAPLGLLIFVQRYRPEDADDRRLPGPLVAALSVAVMLFGWAAGSYTAIVNGALLSFVGFVWSSVGTGGMRRLAAPLVYLFFMVPVPVALYVLVSTKMQLMSSELGRALISGLGSEVTLDGNIIILPTVRLEVAEACSGLRYLFPLLSFAFLVAMQLEDRLWKKATLFASSIFIAIILNAARIALIAVLLERFGLDTSSGASHSFEGFAMFLLCLVLLFVEASILLRIGPTRGRLAATDLIRFDHTTIERLRSWPVSRTSCFALAVLATGAAMMSSLPARTEPIQQRRPFALFPMEIAHWHGSPQPLDQASLVALGLSDYVLADYINPAYPALPVNFYVAYYASQRNGLHVHSPQLCIPGGGWSIISQSVITLPWHHEASIEANRVLVEKDGKRQVVYYWFEERGRHIASEAALKYYALRDALIENRSDGALVRLVVPVIPGDDDSAPDREVRQLMTDVSAILQGYVPTSSN